MATRQQMQPLKKKLILYSVGVEISRFMRIFDFVQYTLRSAKPNRFVLLSTYPHI